MPNIKSAKKRLIQDKKKGYNNLQKKKTIKKLVKQANVLTAEKKKDEAHKMLPNIYKAIDKAVKTNVIKKNTAARKKSRITKKINSI